MDGYLNGSLQISPFIIEFQWDKMLALFCATQDLLRKSKAKYYRGQVLFCFVFSLSKRKKMNIDIIWEKNGETTRYLPGEWQCISQHKISRRFYNQFSPRGCDLSCTGQHLELIYEFCRLVFTIPTVGVSDFILRSNEETSQTAG